MKAILSTVTSMKFFKAFFSKSTTPEDDVPAQLAKSTYILGLISGVIFLAFAFFNKNPILIATNISILILLACSLVYLNKTGHYKVPLLSITGIFMLAVALRSPYYHGAISPTVLSMMLIIIIGPILYDRIVAFVSGNLMVLVFMSMLYCERNSLFGFTPRYKPEFYNHWMLLTFVVSQVAYLTTKTLNDRRIEQINAIKAEKSMKEVLLRTMAHDLSNSLTVILASTSLIEDETAVSEIQGHAKNIESAGRAINSIVRIVRDYEAIYSGKKQISFDEIDLSTCLRSCLDQLNAKIQEKKLSIAVRNTSGIPKVKTNSDIVIHQIFSNILSNAIKFSHAGSIIDVSIAKHGNAVEVAFGDGGIGMEDKALQYLKAGGELGSAKGTLGELGTGFGIQILLSYAKLLGLTVHYEKNKEGPGTLVRVLFPA